MGPGWGWYMAGKRSKAGKGKNTPLWWAPDSEAVARREGRGLGYLQESTLLATSLAPPEGGVGSVRKAGHLGPAQEAAPES